MTPERQAAAQALRSLLEAIDDAHRVCRAAGYHSTALRALADATAAVRFALRMAGGTP
jgi:hypothetical protein